MFYASCLDEHSHTHYPNRDLRINCPLGSKYIAAARLIITLAEIVNMEMEGLKLRRSLALLSEESAGALLFPAPAVLCPCQSKALGKGGLPSH